MQPSELDPLLPKNDPAPEITGHGFSREQELQTTEIRRPDDILSTYDDQQVRKTSGAEDDGSDPEQAIEDTSSRAAVHTLISVFTFVVLFGLIAATLSGGLRGGWFGDDEDARVPTPPHRQPASSVEERTKKILEETPLIDGHNDLAIFLRFAYGGDIHRNDFQEKFENGGLELQVDIPRLRDGMAGGAFWSAFVPCPPNASYDFQDSVYAEATSQTLTQIDLLHRLAAVYPAIFPPPTLSPSSLLSSFRNNHTLLSPLSIEGLHQIPPSSSLATLRLYRSLGVRAATLTWNCHNAFADAALITEPSKNYETIVAPPTPGRNGISDRGRQVIKEMNRLGMLVDLSHTSVNTQRAVLSGKGKSRAPVIFSHSSAFAVCPHPRNVQDEILELVKETESVVMVNFSPGFVSCLPPAEEGGLPDGVYGNNNTIEQVMRHISYIGEMIGWDYVGIGSDYDGMGDQTPRGLESVSNFPDLVKGLLKEGVGDRDVSKVVGGNLLRVWEAAEEVGRVMREEEGVPEGLDDVVRGREEQWFMRKR